MKGLLLLLNKYATEVDLYTTIHAVHRFTTIDHLDNEYFTSLEQYTVRIDNIFKVIRYKGLGEQA